MRKLLFLIFSVLLLITVQPYGYCAANNSISINELDREFSLALNSLDDNTLKQIESISSDAANVLRDIKNTKMITTDTLSKVNNINETTIITIGKKSQIAGMLLVKIKEASTIAARHGMLTSSTTPATSTTSSTPATNPVAAESSVTACLDAISKDKEKWQDMLFDHDKGIFKDIKDTDDITDAMVEKNKNKIYTLIAGNIMTRCNKLLGDFYKKQRATIDFTHNNKSYAFDFSTEKMFDFIDLRTGIVVTNKRTYSSGDVMRLSDFPRNTKLFSDECSDWSIADNLDDDGAVNKIGQSVFNEFGGSKNEFFLDFTEGDNRRAFPGLVLMDETGSTKEKIVTYRNINTGISKAKQFAQSLKSSECSNQGLSVYLVALDVKKDTSSEKKGWMIAAGIGGGAMAWMGLSAGVTYTFLAGGVSALGGALGAAAPGTMAAMALGPVGWIIAGVGVATATAIALYPSEIEDLQQVMVIDGPYNL